jgi:hypothetical protein
MSKRLFSREEAAVYCGTTPREFSRWITRGLMPQRIQHTNRWDRHAIDAAIDRLSNLNQSKGNEHEDAFQQWAHQQRG